MRQITNQFMQVRQIILTAIVFLLFAQATRAQSPNPYKEIGKKGEIVTLTKGDYDEFFDEDREQRIGSTFVDVNTMKVVGLNLTNEEQRQLDNARESRFLSVDPLASKYAYYTPYQFAGNTPIQAIDLDGLEPAYMTTDKNSGRTQITIAGDLLTHRIPELQKPDFINSNGKSGPGEQGEQVLSAVVTIATTVTETQTICNGIKILYNVFKRVPKKESGTETTNETPNVTSEIGEGTIYKRTNPKTNEGYVGKSKDPKNYLKRQDAHDKKLGVKHDYEELETNVPESKLDKLEEDHIRLGGGPINKGGNLANKRYQMNDKNYKNAGGNVQKPTN